MDSVSVVIPTYNEVEIIESQVNRILDAIPKLLEVVVVDDDSPDGTWRIVGKMGEADDKVRLVRRISERGLASAIRKGVSESGGDIVIWLDCDHNLTPSLAESLLSEIEGGADVCIASRYVEGGRELRGLVQKIASRSVNLFAGIVLGGFIHDFTTGFVASRRKVLNEVGWGCKGYGEYCIEFLYSAHKKGFTVREVPFVCAARDAGASKTNMNFLKFLMLGLDYGVRIIQLRFRSFL